ncbi:Shedu immune nuclease family protein [Cystobacter fuscus]|uniref:Shedu immune nuclease family protein n=1 Tax=Cystobacter fuscus TaxID=43 RepID=UPI0037C1A9DA
MNKPPPGGDKLGSRNVLAEPNEVTYARGRRTDCTYIHRSFTLDLRASQDYGQPARFIVKTFDEIGEPSKPGDTSGGLEWMEETVFTTPGGRKQVKLQIAREAGQVRELQIQRVPTNGDATKLENLLTLDREAAARFIEMVHALKYIPVEGEKKLRVDDQTIRDFFADPEAMLSLYSRDPKKFRQIIENDASAEDLIAIAHRKQVVQEFRELLSDPERFERERVLNGGSRERVWQTFLERNPWILGISLAGQLLTSWGREKLEQVVAGFSIAGVGKRADALLRTNGRIRSMVFAEIKHHETELLARQEYRSGCWAPSTELVGGVTQVQQTVHKAARQIGAYLADTDEDGAETREGTFVVRPRSFLIVGHLDQLRGSGGGVHRDKYESFELYRRNLYEPEIVTFDELLARAEWHVAVADESSLE